MNKYTKSKKKFFRKRVYRYYLMYKNKPLLCYGCGLFVPMVDYIKYPIIIKIMNMSDNKAFWYCHKLESVNSDYDLIYETINNSITFQTQWKFNFYK